MNEITRIHLAATPFNIEVGAKKQLEKYLDAIKTALQADDDTLREIEVRICELLAERGVSGERVITASDVEEIERRLGEPADFTDEDAAPTNSQAASGKRLMRDEERGILGGVLAGIAAYMGVDAVWVRLAAIVLAFVSFGTVALVYVVLWLVLPSAKTATDKLQMAGKPVTLSALKDNAGSGTVSTKVKPFVVVLRVILGLGFVVMAIGAIGTTLAALVMGVPALLHNSDLANAWLIGAYVLLVVSGVLFTLLMILAAYVSFAWRFTKVIGYSALAIVIVGLVTASAGFGAGIYGSSVMNDQVISLTKEEKLPLNELNGAQGLVIDSENVPVEYRESEGPARAEVTMLQRGGAKIKMSATRDGDIVTISAKRTESDRDQCFLFGNCHLGSEQIIVYGPSLKDIDVKHGTLRYTDGNVQDIRATVRNDASLVLDGTTVSVLNATIEKNATLYADTSSVTTANLGVSGSGWARVGVVEQLDINAPTSCPASSMTEIVADRVGTLKMNGEVMPSAYITEGGCVKVTIDSLDEASGSDS